jgi:hypothetical protein
MSGLVSESIRCFGSFSCVASAHSLFCFHVVLLLPHPAFLVCCCCCCCCCCLTCWLVGSFSFLVPQRFGGRKHANNDDDLFGCVAGYCQECRRARFETRNGLRSPGGFRFGRLQSLQYVKLHCTSMERETTDGGFRWFI